jgi:hypothetical protein
LIVACAALAGCSHFRHHQAAPATEPTAAATSSTAGEATASPAPQEMTATEAALGAPSASAAPVAASADTSGMLNSSAPMHYTVKKGDTLWAIASMYLKDPWLWPEVWVINPQIPNPHLIYPGDTLALAYGANGHPEVYVEKVGFLRLDPRLRSEPLANAIPTIPYSAISAFLSHPAVMTEDEIRHAPYVLAFRDMHQAGGSGNEVYVRNLTAAANARYAIMHVAGPLVDPDDGKVVGYSGIYTATALVQRAGDPAKATLIDPARETLRGDRLLTADTETPLNFTPHPPAGDVSGRIIDVVGGTDLVGQFAVAVINRGKRHGVEPGTVLAIDQQGDTVPDLFRDGRSIANGNSFMSSFAPRVRLPDERAGTMLVFKTYDRVSYALVVGASNIIRIGDPVRNP